MLSFKKGREIALIKGGKYHNKILYIDDEGSAEPIKNSPLELLNDVYRNTKKSKLKKDEIGLIKKALLNEDKYEELEESLYDIVDSMKSKSRELSHKEFKIFDEGIVVPLPRFNKTERCYIAGQTECGKTYWCRKYLQQLRKVHPQKKIYIFSDVEHDPELDDKIPNLIRFKLDDEMAGKKPPPAEIFQDSICLFDDIDSIQNKKVYTMIQGLRDSLLRRGRHENISTLITSHLLTNYKDTRIILNECNSITIFCRSGSLYGIKYLLKKYVGLDKKQIQKVINLPSRWVTIYKFYPNFVIYEKGVYIV